MIDGFLSKFVFVPSNIDFNTLNIKDYMSLYREKQNEYILLKNNCKYLINSNHYMVGSNLADLVFYNAANSSLLINSELLNDHEVFKSYRNESLIRILLEILGPSFLLIEQIMEENKEMEKDSLALERKLKTLENYTLIKKSAVEDYTDFKLKAIEFMKIHNNNYKFERRNK